MIARACLTPHSPAAAALAAQIASGVPRIETARLTLRAPTLADWPVWEAILCADRGAMGGPFSSEQAWEQFAAYAAGWLLHGHGGMAVECKADGAVAGFVLLGCEWDDPEPELGFMFLPEHRGQGLATEAAAAVRDFGVDLLGAGRFVSYIDPANTPARRLAARLGAHRDRAAEAALGHMAEVWRHPAPEELQ